jgi:hypothetical protein
VEFSDVDIGVFSDVVSIDIYTTCRSDDSRVVGARLFGDDFLTADAGVVVPEMLAIEDDVVRVADAIDTDPAVPVAVAVRVGVGLFSTVLNSCRIERTRPILNSISRPG